MIALWGGVRDLFNTSLQRFGQVKIRHRNLTKSNCKKGFTLAEVLITLGIIGIVAAMTIPTLVQNYQTRAWNTASTVFERKLDETLKIMNSQHVLEGYNSTEDFINEFQKHIKIIKICDNNKLMDCFESKLFWGADAKEIDMTKIKTTTQFGIDWNQNLIGINFANGVSAILAYNPKCKQEPYNAQFSGTSCIAMIYDTSGISLPNTSGKDIGAINVKSLNGSAALCTSNGTCFTSHVIPTSIVCEEHKAELGIQKCRDDRPVDNWSMAVAACGGLQNMPTMQQLNELAYELYPGLSSKCNPLTSICNGFTRNDEKFFKLSTTAYKTYQFFAREEHEDPTKAYYYSFRENGVNAVKNNIVRGGYTYAVIGTLCLAK